MESFRYKIFRFYYGWKWLGGKFLETWLQSFWREAQPFYGSEYKSTVLPENGFEKGFFSPQISDKVR